MSSQTVKYVKNPSHSPSRRQADRRKVAPRRPGRTGGQAGVQPVPQVISDFAIATGRRFTTRTGPRVGGKPVVNVGEVGNQLIRTGAVISAVQNAARGASAAGKLNRFVRAADIGWQLYEWFINRPHAPVQQGYPPPQGGT